MSTPVAHGRIESLGGGETQTATPRILAAELEQRQTTDPGKVERGEEQRPVAEVEATGHGEPRDDEGVLVDDDEARIEEEHGEARPRDSHERCYSTNALAVGESGCADDGELD
jgi:hypothetical protein